MARSKCTECDGELKILGVGNYGDTIETECTDCGEFFEVEPDGLGEGGLEFVDAQMISMRNEEAEE